MARPDTASAVKEEHVGQLARALLEGLKNNEISSIDAPLEEMYKCFKDKGWKRYSSAALLPVWCACSPILDKDLGPEVRPNVPYIYDIEWLFFGVSSICGLYHASKAPNAGPIRPFSRDFLISRSVHLIFS